MTDPCVSTIEASTQSPLYSTMVLLVDDQAMVGEAVRRLLADEPDIELHYCADPADAINQAREIRPTVILQDLVMPGIDGLDLVGLFRANPATAATPIIVLSSTEDPQVKSQAFTAGANDYLVKLPDRIELIARINYHSRAYLSQIQRDEAYRALRESQQQLFDTNTSLFAVNERLRAVNKELEAFSYSVSHDLRAPLRSIDGFAQALMEDCAGQLDATGQNYLQRVRAAALRMGQLIDDLLHLSRLSQAELRRETVELSALAESITTELCHREPERQVEWVIGPGLAAEGDARLLRVALENLLGNAWKYTGTRPHGQIEFGVTNNWGPPVYFVRDNGVGFDMAYAGKLFGVFQRLHGASEFPGTGIGLATVQRIVHRHGGQIWAEAAVDQGATFCFTLAREAREGE